MSHFVRSVKSVLVREEGATMVEYGLMVALIAMVAIAGVGPLGQALEDLFNDMVPYLN